MDYSELPELPPEQEEPLFASAQPTEPDRDDTDALFAVLNLDRDCTADDIKREYKRLAALLHPDRHPLAKEAADTHFQTLNHAYEVLSDPKKRIIYESLGEEGLKTTWEVGNKFKTADELRAEFQRLGRKQLEADVENLVKSRADLTCTVDARVLFLADDERRDLGGPTQLSLQQKLETVTVKQLFLKHSFTTPVTAATSVVLTSQMLARQGVGAGNMLIKVVHRPSSKISLELGTTLLRPRAFSLKGTYSPDSDTFLTFDAPLRNLASPPQLSVTIGRRISENFTLTFSARTGQWAFLFWGRASVQEISSSTISVGLINSAGWSLDATTGVQVGQLSGDYGQTVLGGVKVRMGGMLSTQGGWSTTLSGEKRVTENTKAAMVLELGMNGTMTVRLRLTRLGQRLVLPITVSSSLNPTLVVTFTVLPALSMIAAHHLIILPRKKRRFTSRIVELREENSEYIAEKRKEAVDAVTLLQDHVAKRVEVERANNGLIIIKATYGILPRDSAPRDPSALALDVTIALQSLVANSQLVIPGGRSKSNLLGFYDCAMGEQKQLHVRYLFKGRLHEFTVEDRGAVSAPLRAHWIDA